MIDRYITRRPRSRFWQLRVPLPIDIQIATHRKEFTKSLGTEDRKDANERAIAILAELHEEWQRLRNTPATSSFCRVPTDFELKKILSSVYHEAYSNLEQTRSQHYLNDPAGFRDYLEKREASLVSMAMAVSSGEIGKWEGPAEKALLKAGYQVDRSSSWFEGFVSDFAQVTIDVVHTCTRRNRGDLGAEPTSPVVKNALAVSLNPIDSTAELSFLDLSKLYLVHWKTDQAVGKVTNTEQQKQATFGLFAGFWGNKPIRLVKKSDAAAFHDAIKRMDPNWARNAKARSLDWAALQKQFGNHDVGLAAQTMNRHMRSLQSLWSWAKDRAHCSGDNPFVGFSKKLKKGVVASYLPWEPCELETLFQHPPKRQDLLEVMVVALYTGMRLDEICSLTWGDVRTDPDHKGLHYFHVGKAKTPAGVRQVPIHTALSWITARTQTASHERIWPKFNDEGPGKKPGADAGRAFSDYKLKLGFSSRRKVFHSFRKNVTQIMERAGVRESDWAQVIGHERGFTYGTYSPHGITMRQRADIIAKINYGDLCIPVISP